MNLCTIGHSFCYETEKLCRIFLPFEKINIIDTVEITQLTAVTCLERGEKETLCSAELYIQDKTDKREEKLPNDADDKLCELTIAKCLFNCFVTLTGYKPDWGILTGVRPAKLYAKLCRSEGQQSTEEYFKNQLFVQENKISLCRETFGTEHTIIEKSKGDWFSLYLSIPFCPTRCAYCSFVSHSIDKAGKLVPDYVELLCKELACTADYARQCGLKLKTVYMGGGTPTSITALQLDRVLSSIEDNFDLSGVLEFTVEAGRPDTVDAEKLRVLKKHQVSRISINPQTMNDAVLENIGRRHTAKDTRQAFALAREIGFDNINMDVIAGLPGDTPESFKATIDELIALAPESITVHSLAMKRASTLSTSGVQHDAQQGRQAAQMVEYAHSALTKAGILPYYMYRQSKTVGNLENVGYAVKGAECLYNVYIMDETHTILACGASAVTKLKSPVDGNISRIFNFKYPYEYTSRFEQLINRKEGIKEFYEKYPVTDK